ncbi:MAG: class I SAM-dependent RNA methyltransferase, partial [Acidimicrobiales bacterium]
MSERVVVEVEKMVAGGLALGHAPSGQVVLATGGLPGERVEVRIDTQRKRLLQGVVTEVHEPSDDRRSEPCPEVSRGCGGCDLQHATPAAQRDIKVDIVRDALARLARLTDVEVTPGVELGAERYRTTLRCGVVDGRLGFRSHHSHDIHGVDDCLVAHDAVAEIVRDGRFGGATEVVIRAGARTGERMVVVSPTAESVSVPPDVVVVGNDELDAGHRAWIHEEVAGHRFRISARSFFQARPDGADALVDAVG